MRWMHQRFSRLDTERQTSRFTQRTKPDSSSGTPGCVCLSMRLYVSTGFATLRITRDSQQRLRKENTDADSQIVLDQAVLAIDAVAVGPVPRGVVEAALVGDDHLPEACVDSGGDESQDGCG